MSKDFGLKISLPGVDVNNATPEECVIHSGYPNPKIKTDANPAHFNTIDYTFPNDPNDGILNIATIPHKLGYVPMSIVFAQNYLFGLPAIFQVLPIFVVLGTVDPTAFQIIRAYSDGTNLKIDYQCTNKVSDPLNHISMAGVRIVFKYYIFVDKD